MFEKTAAKVQKIFVFPTIKEYGSSEKNYGVSFFFFLSLFFLFLQFKNVAYES